MLAEQNIIKTEEADQIIQGLKDIQDDYYNGNLELSESLEDIHLNIEHALIQKIGQVGGKLHTGRSRNDQVATDMHLYTKQHVQEILTLIESLQNQFYLLQMNMCIPSCQDTRTYKERNLYLSRIIS